MSNQLAMDIYSADHVELLRDRLGEEWPFITAARTRSRDQLDRLDRQLFPLVPQDTTGVVFGSLARLEFTELSDVDWTMLVDGYADSEHRDVADRIRGRLGEMGLSHPTAGGPFGHLTFSHDLIHRIGGEDDTNHNTTQRLLLLLESAPFGNSAAYGRVVRQVLTRYVEEDLGPADTPYRVPRFLLNDIVRYWRTMTVDFAHKRRARGPTGWALRTAKLRMSRKLMYASGLLSCFSCDFLLGARPTPNRFLDTTRVVDHLSALVQTTPLDIVARVVLSYFDELSAPARSLFSAYDEFLGLLSSEEQRRRLKSLRPEEADEDPVYGTVRKLGLRFEDALTEMFFTRETPVRGLTQRFGVF